MKQHEAVIQTLERLGGQATLAQLNREVLKIKECEWKTKTPFASIRRIVQERPEIFKVRPGLWALEAYKSALNLSEYQSLEAKSTQDVEQTHSYYQGLLIEIGNLRGFDTYVPPQDKNRLFINRRLADLTKLSVVPLFSYASLVKRSSTVDVIWFNERNMPNSLFEVEHSTDFQNSLSKFSDLQDFYTRMIIVADDNKKAEYEHKLSFNVFKEVRKRVNFLGYESLVKQHEIEYSRAAHDFVL